MPGRDTTPAVKLYPIPALIKAVQGDLRGQIVKLTSQGFLVEVPPSNSQPGEFVTAVFELAGLPAVTVTGRIVKYYSQWAGGLNSGSSTAAGGSTGSSASGSSASNSAQANSAGAASASAGSSSSGQTPSGKTSASIGHLMEVHFQNLPVAALESISTFLRLGSKIGRK